MEAAGNGNNNVNNGNNVNPNMVRIQCQMTSPLSLATAEKVMRRPRRRLDPNSRITLYDNTTPGHGWLLPGWLCEERVMPTGRVYRYYYDPDAILYTTQQEVLAVWERCGLVVLDK